MNIILIGAGNLAYHLGKAVKNAGHNILQTYSRTMKSAKKLSQIIDAEPITELNLLSEDAYLYIISVSDNAINEILQKIDISNKNIVHTAGSIDMSVLSDAKNFGVFYPLQTFSKHAELDFKKIPICIEASNNNFFENLYILADQISDNVQYINSAERRQIHLSAVFACNFVNHMFSLAKNVLDEKNINFDILQPLIQESVSKVFKSSPKLSQTGPAIRNDTNIIEKHLELLSSQPDTQKIYELITNNIKEFHNKKQ